MKMSAQPGQHLVKTANILDQYPSSKPTVQLDSVATASQAVSLSLQMVQPSLKEVEVPSYYILPFHLKLHLNGIKWLLKQGLSRRWLIQTDKPGPSQERLCSKTKLAPRHSLETWASVSLGGRKVPWTGRDGQITDRHHVYSFVYWFTLLLGGEVARTQYFLAGIYTTCASAFLRFYNCKDSHYDPINFAALLIKIS